jgi:hypothetical protein
VVSLFASGRAALSVLALCALTACGGGGDSGVTAKEGELIVIDAGSSTLPGKTFTLDTTYGRSYATFDDTSVGTVVTISPENTNFDTSLSFVQDTPSKFVVFFNAQVAGAAMGTYKVFGCRSNAWTSTELSFGTAANLPICGEGITIDATNRRAAYINLSLPALDIEGKAMVISASFSWPVPVSSASLIGTSNGSGSGSGSFGPTTTAAPIETLPPVTISTSGSTLIANPGATLGSNVTTAPAVAGGGSIAISAPPSPATPTTPRTAGSIEVTTAGGSTGTTSLPSAPAAPGTVAATSN